ncbi:MAG: hypothetical protein A3H33_15620 [Betaproteobacteria bacterium RIFCSPLOWO2_02_FULL_65_20]|nr:MAG: hypothetical protein A3H33_15620 [Betaproteobacteria bacterium RIFCSPLOWO2_02_FULL_65_20]
MHKRCPSGYSACRSNAVDTKIDAHLEFRIRLVPYDGDDAWVEGALVAGGGQTTFFLHAEKRGLSPIIRRTA